MTVPVEPQPAFVPKQKNGVGLSATIVGAVALLFAIIPLVSFIAWLPAIVAIVLGIVGLVLKNRVRTTAWIGLALGVVAWIVSIIVSFAAAAGIAGAISEAIESAPALTALPSQPATDGSASEPTGDRKVIYEVTSDAGTVANVTYLTATTAGSGQSQETDVAAPFIKEIAVDQSGIFSVSAFSLVAQATGDASTISCKITYDGNVLAEQTSTGPYSVVSCVGSD